MFVAYGLTDCMAAQPASPSTPNTSYHELASLELKSDAIINLLTQQDQLKTSLSLTDLWYGLEGPVCEDQQEKICAPVKESIRYVMKDLVPPSFWEEELMTYYAKNLESNEVKEILGSYARLDTIQSGKKLLRLRLTFISEVLPELAPKLRTMSQGFKVPGPWMKPSILAGDHIIVNKLAYQDHSPEYGDIVVFKYPEDESKVFVKRIIGIPGDNIELRKKVVYVNGQALEESQYTQHVDPRIIEKSINPRDHMDAITVPADSYFVLGDNRDQSLDSRFWGFVKKDKILGKASRIYWSWDKDSKTVRWNRIGQEVH